MLINEYRFLLHRRVFCVLRALVLEPTTDWAFCAARRGFGHWYWHEKTLASRAHRACELTPDTAIQSRLSHAWPDAVEWSVDELGDSLVWGWLSSSAHSHPWEHETLVDRAIFGGYTSLYKASSREDPLLHVLQYAFRETTAWCGQRAGDSRLEVRWDQHAMVA